MVSQFVPACPTRSFSEDCLYLNLLGHPPVFSLELANFVDVVGKTVVVRLSIIMVITNILTIISKQPSSTSSSCKWQDSCLSSEVLFVIIMAITNILIQTTIMNSIIIITMRQNGYCSPDVLLATIMIITNTTIIIQPAR